MRQVAPGTDGRGVPGLQLLQVGWQVRRHIGHRDVPDEDGNHGNVELQGRRDLDPYQVFGIVQPPLAFLGPIHIPGIQPTVSYDRQENITLADGLTEPFDEIGSWRNTFHVDKDRLLTKPLLQLFMELLGHESAVVAPVRDEDFGHRCDGAKGRQCHTTVRLPF